MRVKVSITQTRINPGSVFSSIANGRTGGSVFFLGTVRSDSKGMKVRSMSLESAKDLAEKDLRSICRRASEKYDVNDILVIHRIGRLRVGDVIVAIGVGASHRKAAFGACRFIIDELKKTTPIWKKEIGPGKERWV